MFLAAALCALTPLTDVHVDAQAACAAGDGSLARPFCTVTEALAVAADGDNILISPGVYSELLDVTEDVSLVGTGGADATMLSGGGAGTVVTIRPGSKVRMVGLTIMDGLGASGSTRAGGIRSEGELTLIDSILRDNGATTVFPEVAGPAILHDSPGRLIVRGCTLRRNEVPSDNFSSSGPVLLRGTGTALFEACTFTDNRVFSCGAIRGNGGSLTVRRCAIYGNDSAPSIGFAAVILIESGSLRIEDSTIHNNLGTGLQIRGGGGPFILESCTVTQNTGSGVFANSIDAFGFTVEIGNTVVEGGFGLSMVGTFLSQGTNHLQASSNGLFSITDDPTDIIRVSFNQEPRSGLLPLTDNGGPTLTRLPRCGSVLIDSGPQSPNTATDQRGFARPLGRVDRGAVEADCVSVPSCATEPNSTGSSGQTLTIGPVLVSENNILLGALELPPNVFGIFLVSATEAFTPNPGGSAGNLCLGGTIGRFVRPGQLFETNPFGAASLQIDLTVLPQGSVTAAATPGETWLFQAWHRDRSAGQQTSNYAEAVALTVR